MRSRAIGWILVGLLAAAIVASAQQRDIAIVSKNQVQVGDQTITLYRNGWALVVGINDYRSSKVPDLKYAVRDAKAVKRMLIELGFPEHNILELYDSAATRRAIEAKLDVLARKAQGNDRMVIYFAGHGTDYIGRGGEKLGFIVPVDGEPSRLYATCLSMANLRDAAKMMRARHVFYLIDACYSGMIGVARSMPKGYGWRYIERVWREQAVQIMTAGTKSQQVFEDARFGGGHSAFAYHLLRGLDEGLADSDGDGIVLPSELLAYLQPRVLRDTDGIQKPVLFNMSGEGEFIFVVGGPQQKPAPPKESAQAKPAPPPVQPSEPPAGEVEADLSKYDRLIQEAEQAKRQEEAERLRREREKAQYGARRDAAWQKVRPIVQGDYPRQVKVKAATKFAQDFPKDNPYLEELESELRASIEALALNPFVEVSAGAFMMGCAPNDSSCDDTEKPYHEVYLDAYYIQKHEVTVAEYRECVNAGACTKPRSKSNNSYCNWGYGDRDDHLINCVDWHQAKAYCEWIGARLPTEAEWEKAARGTDGRKYPWGNAKATCEYAVMDDGGNGCGRGRTWSVCSKPRGDSPYGLCDMAGNVWEWVNDWYGENYYESSPRDNPWGPSSGSARVLRGGSWCNDPWDLRTSCRNRTAPSNRDTYLGFRCACGNR